MSALPDANLHFRIQLNDRAAHRLRVVCTVDTPAADGQVFAFASWTRGSYLVRDFARHITWLRAEASGQPVSWQRLDKRSLQCAPCSGPLSLEYEIHAFDPSVRKAFLDTTRGFINGTSVFPKVAGQDGAISVELVPADVEDWSAATTLTPVETDKRGFGSYVAQDWEEVIDHPISFGPLRRVRFAADGIDHELVFTGLLPARLDEARLREDLTRICETQRALFGNEPALTNYQFQTAVTAASYGGLEHRASCALVCARDDLPVVDAPTTARYRTFLGLCSHEYFHLWNVKRITADAFAQSDLGSEAYTRDLWAYEGVTSYYDDYLLLRAGCLTTTQYLELLAAMITRVARTPGRALHSLAESSFEAWTKFYQPDDNLPNATVSYYAKGALVALLLDLRLRRDSRITLDDVMRGLWQQYGRDGNGVPEGGLEALAIAESGLDDLATDFNAWLRGTGELPIDEMLADFGIRLTRDVDSSHAEQHAWIGLRLCPNSTELAGVVEGSPAQRAGLGGGDQLVALDDMQLHGHNLTDRFAQLQAGQEVRLHYFRDQQLRETRLTPEAAHADRVSLTLDDDASDRARALRDGWLGAPTQ